MEPERRDRLWANVERMRRGFRELGLEVFDGGGPILSVIVGTDDAAFEFNRMLFQQGVFVNPVVSPAVPPGMSLLRTSYMATHTEEDLARVLAAFRKVADKLRIAR